MSELFFIVWVCIALTQISLFAFYMGKSLSQGRVEHKETIDTFPIYVYNGMAYWYEKDLLYRTKYKARGMDLNNKQKIDYLNLDDLSPADIIQIINELEEAEK